MILMVYSVVCISTYYLMTHDIQIRKNWLLLNSLVCLEWLDAAGTTRLGAGCTQRSLGLANDIPIHSHWPINGDTPRNRRWNTAGSQLAVCLTTQNTLAKLPLWMLGPPRSRRWPRSPCSELRMKNIGYAMSQRAFDSCARPIDPPSTGRDAARHPIRTKPLVSYIQHAERHFRASSTDRLRRE